MQFQFLSRSLMLAETFYFFHSGKSWAHYWYMLCTSLNYWNLLKKAKVHEHAASFTFLYFNEIPLQNSTELLHLNFSCYILVVMAIELLHFEASSLDRVMFVH